MGPTAMGGTSRTLGYRYDPDSNRTYATHPDNVQFRMHYDGPRALFGHRITVASWRREGMKLPFGKYPNKEPALSKWRRKKQALTVNGFVGSLDKAARRVDRTATYSPKHLRGD